MDKRKEITQKIQEEKGEYFGRKLQAKRHALFVPCRKFDVNNGILVSDVVSVHPIFENRIVNFQINIHNKHNEQHS